MNSGDKLGPYEILSLIGKGGMGEVYRARDPRLGRDVAIKVSAARFSERFEREARAVAALNHPNICTLYDVGPNYLVMEYIEGESPKGPLALEEALRIARQIAEALEAAHEKPIVHRDLKPANIKIKPDGLVKVLDFGLAKMHEPPGEDGDTIPLGKTEDGAILGTPAYMSPEQAVGKKADKRADIWAFGVVLYEMLTGERPFKGKEIGDILESVVKEQPDLNRVPANVRRLLQSCLEKDRNKRLRDIGDAWRQLDEAPAVPSSRSRLAWIAAGVFALALGALAFIHFRETPPERAVLRYTIAPPENATSVHSFAISPDGHLLAIAAEVSGKRQLWLRPLDALQAQPMPGTEDATFPFWSPDSRYIGFFAQGKLKKIAASGGPAQSLCDAADGRGGSWNRDGVIVFSPSGNGSPIQRVSADGGVPAGVTEPQAVSVFPVFLHDGRHFLYVRIGGGVYLSSLDGKENRRVLTDQLSVVFAGGRLLFVRENTLMAQPFDAAKGRTTGEVFPVAEGVSSTTNITYAPVTVSETGVLVYERGAPAGGNQMAWYDRGGKLLGAVGAPGRVFEPAISPDEKSVVFRRNRDLWLRDLARGTDQRFTTDTSLNVTPFWSPHGDRVTFASDRGGGGFHLYQKAASGTGRDEPLLATGAPSQWSRDGRFIVYVGIDPKTRKISIWVLPTEGGAGRKPSAFLHSEFNELFGQLSPDSHWMAYTSDETGQREVYVRPFPAGDGQWRISPAGGEQPRWRGDGKELFFVGSDGKMMAVAVKAVAGNKPSFEPGPPQPLFQAHLAQVVDDALFQYDVTADGKRFLLDTTGVGSSAPVPPLTVVSNWAAGLKK